jgi:peroxiredoxin
MLRLILNLIVAWSCLSHSVISSAIENGQKVPNCQLSTFDSVKSFNFQDAQGKVLYVDFWASWCPPCAKSFSYMNELHRDLKAKGLEVLVVNLDEEQNEAKKFLTSHPGNFTVLADASKHCAEDFNVEGMPSTYLIDRKGVVRHIHLGFKAEDAPMLRAKVEQLLAEP